MTSIKDATYNMIFVEKLVEDDRDPFMTFEMPGIEGKFGVLAPKSQFWVKLLLLLVGQMILLSMFASAIYKLIIPNRGTTFAYLVGFGIIIPVVSQLPYPIMEYFDVQNRSLKLSLASLPTHVTFRCIEAMYGTSRDQSQEHSLSNYVSSLVALVDYQWDGKTHKRVRITQRQLMTNIWRIVSQFLMVSVLLSYLLVCNFKPFDSPVSLHEYNLTLDLLAPSHLANCYFYALLTFFTLSVGFNLTALGPNLQGWVTRDLFRNPLFTSSCPSDFWARKWNLLIHERLKRGTYLPVKKFFPAPVAVCATFISSGILHDYTWTVIFYHQKRTIEAGCLNCFVPILFKQTAFFLYCGLTMMLEKPVGRFPPIQWLAQHLPLPIVSTCVLFTALPFAHWYTGDWIQGGFFEHFTLGLLRIIKIE